MIDLNTLDTLGKCRQTMNQALLSSKKMDYCTPKAFFEKLNAEFHFVLDAAATEKSAKCPKYYTPETNGLSKSWNIGGQYFATLHMDERLGNGWRKLIKSKKTGLQSFF